MPNWVHCQFESIGDLKQFEKVAVNKDNEIDFNILIPMPDTMDILYPQQTEPPAGFTFPEVTEETAFDLFLQACVDKGCSVAQALAHWNKEKYGAYSWYDWCDEHWGTAHNACGSMYEPECMPWFETAWGVPVPWLEKLAAFTDFVLVYADEDLAYNCGIVKAENGVVTIDVPEFSPLSTVLACYVHHGDATKEELENLAESNPGISAFRDAVENFDSLYAELVKKLEA